jgi:hypothetical protein
MFSTENVLQRSRILADFYKAFPNILEMGRDWAQRLIIAQLDPFSHLTPPPPHPSKLTFVVCQKLIRGFLCILALRE